MSDEPLTEAELTSMEATIRASAARILACFDRSQVPTEVALAVLGVVIGELLDRTDADTRTEFIACLEDD